MTSGSSFPPYHAHITQLAMNPELVRLHGVLLICPTTTCTRPRATTNPGSSFLMRSWSSAPTTTHAPPCEPKLVLSRDVPLIYPHYPAYNIIPWVTTNPKLVPLHDLLLTHPHYRTRTPPNARANPDLVLLYDVLRIRLHYHTRAQPRSTRSQKLVFLHDVPLTCPHYHPRAVSRAATYPKLDFFHKQGPPLPVPPQRVGHPQPAPRLPRLPSHADTSESNKMPHIFRSHLHRAEFATSSAPAVA